MLFLLFTFPSRIKLVFWCICSLSDEPWDMLLSSNTWILRRYSTLLCNSWYFTAKKIWRDNSNLVYVFFHFLSKSYFYIFDGICQQTVRTCKVGVFYLSSFYFKTKYVLQLNFKYNSNIKNAETNKY